MEAGELSGDSITGGAIGFRNTEMSLFFHGPAELSFSKAGPVIRNVPLVVPLQCVCQGEM